MIYEAKMAFASARSVDGFDIPAILTHKRVNVIL